MKSIILVILSLIVTGKCGRILGIYSHAGKSHHTLGEIMLKELARRGHEVTMISTFPLKQPFPNYTDIYLDGHLEEMGEFEDIYLYLEKNRWFNIIGAAPLINHFTNKTFRHPKVLELIKSGQKFDVVFLDYFCKSAELYYGHIFNAPVVLVASFGMQNVVNYILNNPDPAAYVPSSGTSHKPEMGFWERMDNAFYSWFTYGVVQLIEMQQEDILRQNFPDAPTIDELKSRLALVFTNSHHTVESPRPYLPNIIPIGGIHVEDAKPLPADLQQFMDNSKEGVIFFTLGSHLKTSILPKEKIEAILKALSKLPQKVLLKWETDEIPLSSKNILTRKWFPQTSLLAHPNLKAIVTHGGLMTKFEAIHYGVPMVAIPFFGDQKTNVAHSVSEGIAIRVSLSDLSETTFFEALTEIVNNSSYRKNIKIKSEMLRNQPMKPADVLAYWTEHLIKFRSARHLQNEGLKLYWFQNMMLDVLAFLVVVFALIIWLLRRILCRIGSSLAGESEKERRKTKAE